MVFKLFIWSEHGRGKSPDHIHATRIQFTYDFSAQGGRPEAAPPEAGGPRFTKCIALTGPLKGNMRKMVFEWLSGGPSAASPLGSR